MLNQPASSQSAQTIESQSQTESTGAELQQELQELQGELQRPRSVSPGLNRDYIIEMALPAGLIVVLLYLWFRAKKKFLKEEPEQAKPELKAEAKAESEPKPEAKVEVFVKQEQREPEKKAQQSPEPQAPSWSQKLRAGLKGTGDFFVHQLGFVLGKKELDAATLEQLHETLYRSDIGVEATEALIDDIKASLSRGQTLSLEELKSRIQKAFFEALSINQSGSIKGPSEGPLVILIVGVNGVGKTTSIGKLAANFHKEGKKVLLCAADTYRAAASEQLSLWAQRVGVDIIKQKAGADPAAVAFDGMKAAQARGVDVLLIDTAGRLHNKSELMDELAKIRRVLTKAQADAPHETWLVLDASTGQNAVQQVKVFSELLPLSGLIVTKLDGTAKGGIVVNIKKRFGLPIRFIGVGEKAEDLREFSAEDFSQSLFS